MKELSPAKKTQKVEIEGFDILKHILVPKHRKLTEQEVKQLLENYDISELQLPTLPSTDPVAKKLGLKPGDVVEVTRDGITKKYPYFRRVV